MFQDYFRNSEWLDLPVIGLVFFFLFFLGVLWRVFRLRNRGHYQEMAALPLAADGGPENEDSHDG